MERRAFLALGAAGLLTRPARADVFAGRVVHYESVASRRVDPRKVSVWLPPGYDAGVGRYNVLYMHDGQNLFDPATAPFGEWGVDEILSGMIARGEVPPTIVVGVWNTRKRYSEYAPTDLFETVRQPTRGGLAAETHFPLQGDDYLSFLCDELKPLVDRTYRTRPQRRFTSTMGSSMGGLISFYAGMKRPEVFGQVGCVSIHWPLGVGDSGGVPADVWKADLLQALTDYLRRNLPRAGARNATRWYFDGGTVGLDAAYAPYQAHVDAIYAAKGYVQGRDILSRSYPGATHNEAAWRARLPIPLKFLLAPNSPVESGAGQA